MKRFLSLSMVALVLLGLGCAQKNSRPWYGSKIGVDAILKSEFCKKYQCQKIRDHSYQNSSTKKQNRGYELLTDYDSEWDTPEKSIGKGNQKIRLLISENETQNLFSLRIVFNGGYGVPPYTTVDEISTQYLTDLVAVALGKKYRYVPRDGDANPTDDMNTKCMTGIGLSKKVYRVLEQGKIVFEGETKARPYVAYCMVRPSRDNPNEWPKINQPMFAIYDSVYIPK